MHYTISMEVLGQTQHVIYTTQVIKLFRFYTFYGFLNFQHTQKQSIKVRSTNKKVNKAKTYKRNLMTCETLSTWMHQWSNVGHTREMSQGMIPTLMVLRRDSNQEPSSGLVKILAFWLSVLLNSNHTTFSSTKSRMKWYWISICFGFECWTEFLDRLMAIVLSQKTHMVS